MNEKQKVTQSEPLLQCLKLLITDLRNIWPSHPAHLVTGTTLLSGQSHPWTTRIIQKPLFLLKLKSDFCSFCLSSEASMTKLSTFLPFYTDIWGWWQYLHDWRVPVPLTALHKAIKNKEFRVLSSPSHIPRTAPNRKAVTLSYQLCHEYVALAQFTTSLLAGLKWESDLTEVNSSFLPVQAHTPSPITWLSHTTKCCFCNLWVL